MVSSKLFDVGVYVWKVILSMDRRDKTLGKLSSNWEGPFKISHVFSNNAYEIKDLSSEGRVLQVSGEYLKKYKPILQEKNRHKMQKRMKNGLLIMPTV